MSAIGQMADTSLLRLVDERPPGPGLTDFALWLRANGCSETTIEARLNHVADFTRHHPSFPNVNPMHVTAWLGREGYAPWSRRGYYGHLRIYFAFAVENDLLPSTRWPRCVAPNRASACRVRCLPDRLPRSWPARGRKSAPG